jgi:hypothetical protein
MPRAVRDPPGAVLREFHPADTGHVPQEAVTPAGHQERDGHLAVALHEVQYQALLVQPAVPVLAEAVQPLARVGAEPLLVPAVAVAGGHEQPGTRPPEVRPLLGEQFCAAVGAHEPDQRVRAAVHSGLFDDRGERAVADPSGVAVDGDHRPPGLRRDQCARHVVQDFVLAHPDPQAVVAPRLDAEYLVAQDDLERRAVVANRDHAYSSVGVTPSPHRR